MSLTIRFFIPAPPDMDMDDFLVSLCLRPGLGWHPDDIRLEDDFLFDAEEDEIYKWIKLYANEHREEITARINIRLHMRDLNLLVDKAMITMQSFEPLVGNLVSHLAGQSLEETNSILNKFTEVQLKLVLEVAKRALAQKLIDKPSLDQLTEITQNWKTETVNRRYLAVHFIEAVSRMVHK